ncbi:MAG TPA: hypothetical protein VK447_09410 [Myxococcaceae bacterium]|nr:hypothetical protein [Myxococcaceae bacterium]
MASRTRRAALALALGCGVLGPGAARAAGTVRIDEDRSISVALALRVSAGGAMSGLPEARTRTYDLGVDAALLALGGEFNKQLKAQINAARVPTGDFRVVDAIAIYEPFEQLRIWAGRMLPASDRANLSGPFFSTTGEVPFVATNVPGQAAGRDDGLSAWGQLRGGVFKYQLGAFRGRTGGPNVTGYPLVTGRLTLNLLAPEPGYYAAGTYLGTRDVLSFGAGARYQADAAGTPEARGSFSVWNLDALAEKQLPFGTVTLEAAVYRYGLDGVTDATLKQGLGFYVAGGVLPAWHLGSGRTQVTFRYQAFLQDEGPRRTRVDANAYYLVSGYFVRLGLGVSSEDAGTGTGRNDAARLSVQLIL